MTELESKLTRVMRSKEGAAPDFAETFEAATQRAERRSTLMRASIPVAAAVVLVAVIVGRPEPGFVYVSEAELFGATSWQAPSDELLPTRQFDIYRDLPDLVESTKPDGETL